jgi:excisionase family DNA binding protein
MNQEPNDRKAMGMDMGASDDVESEVDPTDVSPHVGFADVEEFEQRVILERHTRHDRHDPTHVDLMQEDYTPEEVARLVGTSLDVVMHAIYSGELKANRQGNKVICIDHKDVAHWLRERQGV